MKIFLKLLDVLIIFYSYLLKGEFKNDIVNDEWDEIKIKLQGIFNADGFHAKIKEGTNYDNLKLLQDDINPI